MDPTELGVSDVQLTWVVNDVALGPLRQEHGYAVWIKMPGGTVLLDTGGSGDVLVGNLAALGLNPADLDAVVVSHAHDDHTGGLSDLLPLLRPGTPLYAHPTLFRRRYSTSSGKMVDRGIPVQEEVLSARMDLRLSAAPALVVPGVWVSGEISERPELEGRSAHHWVYEAGAFRPDPYEDDVSVVIEVGRGDYFLLCGCCHAGLLNTLKTVDSRWHGRWIGIGGGSIWLEPTLCRLLRRSRRFVNWRAWTCCGLGTVQATHSSQPVTLWAWAMACTWAPRANG